MKDRGGAKRGWMAVVLGLACAVAMMQIVRKPTMRVSLAEELPPVIGELEQHINVEDSRAFLNEIRDKGLSGQTLHPYGDLNPFTHLPEEDNNPESVIRRAKTKAIVQNADVESQQEMSDAQQAARDFMGSDAGCTHKLVNQQDYKGNLAQTVSGENCLPWADAVKGNLSLGELVADPQHGAYVADAIAQGELGSYCRNPMGVKIAAWCFLESAKKRKEDGEDPEAEGELWEYCDVGRRCAVDMPILKTQPTGAALKIAPQPGAQMLKAAQEERVAQLKAAAAEVEALKAPAEAAALTPNPQGPLPQLRAVAAAPQALALLRGPSSVGPVLASHVRQMRGRAMARASTHTQQHSRSESSAIKARRISNLEPQGRQSLSHKQQLALVSAKSAKHSAIPFAGTASSRAADTVTAYKTLYFGGRGLTGRQARKLVGKDWFSADKRTPSAVDTGLDKRLSDVEARRQLDQIFA